MLRRILHWLIPLQVEIMWVEELSCFGDILGGDFWEM
jgi:hypothetical protein